jgi:hypothetical protein
MAFPVDATKATNMRVKRIDRVNNKPKIPLALDVQSPAKHPSGDAARSPWTNRKKALTKRCKTYPMPTMSASDDLDEDNKSGAKAPGRQDDNMRSRSMGPLSSNSKKQVTRIPRAQSQKQVDSKPPSFSRWQSEPLLEARVEPNRLNPQDKLNRWESSPRKAVSCSPNPRRPNRALVGKTEAPVTRLTDSPRLPRRITSLTKEEKISFPFGKPGLNEMTFARDQPILQPECLKQTVTGIGFAA